MNSLEWHVRLVGFLQIGLALAHVPIAHRFEWGLQATRLSLLNQKIFLVHAFFVAFIIGLIGLLSWGWADALVVPSALGKPILAGIELFWVVRLILQWTVFDRQSWATASRWMFLHYAFTAFSFYVCAVYACCFYAQWG